jgi:hypothetical protein
MKAVMRSIDWDDPAARAKLVEEVGIPEYNRLFQQHCRRSSRDYNRLMQQALAGEGGNRLCTTYAHRLKLKPKTVVLRNKPYGSLMEGGIQAKGTHHRLMEGGLHGRAGKQNATYAALMKGGLKK